MAGRILIVDDGATNRIVLKVKLTAAFYYPMLASTGAEGIRLARNEQPDIILLDLKLPDMGGVEVLRRLRADPVTRAIPVIVVSAAGDTSARIAALQAGADAILPKPVEDQMLLARMRSLIAARTEVEGLTPELPLGPGFGALAEAAEAFAAPGLIAIIGGDMAAAERLRLALRPLLCDRLVICDRKDALGGRIDGTPDAYLIDADLDAPNSGLRLMSDLRSRANARHAAICIRRPADRPDLAPIAFDLGAHEVVAENDDPREIAARLKAALRRKDSADRLRASVRDRLLMALVDPLTGLHNRRYATSRLAVIARQAQTEGSSFAVMIADIDRFKQVNDNWGHPAGDQVLIEVARRLQQLMRAEDVLGRIGGEEFLIAVPRIHLDEARSLAERLCSAVDGQLFHLPKDQRLKLTLSVGLAIGDGRDMASGDGSVAQLIEQADQALLAAKAKGRNRVTVGSSAA